MKMRNLRNEDGVVQFAIYNSDGTLPKENYQKYCKKSTEEN